MSEKSLQELFGSIDIYLFDQLLKGRLVPGMPSLSAGQVLIRSLAVLATTLSTPVTRLRREQRSPAAAVPTR